jgi:hypothetical protein
MNKSKYSKVRIVLANGCLVDYPEAAGLFMCFLQHFKGLQALGHDVYWLELYKSAKDESRDQHLRDIFFERMHSYGLGDRTIIAQYADTHTIDDVITFGRTQSELNSLIESADLLWNFAYALRPPLLLSFKRRALIDVDPGVLQLSAQSWEMGQSHHHLFFTVGMKMHDPDCQVPTLDQQWHRFPPLVYLPMWTVGPDPGPAAPFSTVTQWNWKEIWDNSAWSISKRSAYVRYIDIPKEAKRPFLLAANIHPDDDTRDREMLAEHGWKYVSAHDATGSPTSYVDFIAASRAEFSFPKAIYRELNTGWLSDRSACYLASGRPVLAEETGFSNHFKTGSGLVPFRNAQSALEGIKDIDSDYAKRSWAARAFAEEHLDSAPWLEKMLAICNSGN